MVMSSLRVLRTRLLSCTESHFSSYGSFSYSEDPRPLLAGAGVLLSRSQLAFWASWIGWLGRHTQASLRRAQGIRHGIQSGFVVVWIRVTWAGRRSSRVHWLEEMGPFDVPLGLLMSLVSRIHHPERVTSSYPMDHRPKWCHIHHTEGLIILSTSILKGSTSFSGPRHHTRVFRSSSWGRD